MHVGTGRGDDNFNFFRVSAGLSRDSSSFVVVNLNNVDSLVAAGSSGTTAFRNL
jgi:hypothetical protein